MTDKPDDYNVFNTQNLTDNGTPSYAIARSAHDAIASLASTQYVQELQPGQFLQIRSQNQQIVVMSDSAGNIHAWPVLNKII